MKKICLLLAVCLMLGCIAGCGNDSEETQPSTQLSETTSPTNEIPSEDTVPPTTEPPIPQVIGYEFDVPEKFVASISENDRMVYVSPNAPTDTSAIEVQISTRNEDILLLDSNAYMQMNQLEENQEYHSIDVQLTQIDGIDALFVDYVIQDGGVYTHIYEYHVVGDRNYMFRFSDSTDQNDWLELYEDAVDSIDMLTQDENVVLDYSHLEKYTLDCGINLYAGTGMQEQTASGFTACLGSREAIILLMRDNKEEHDLVGLSLQEYADLVSQANDLDQFTKDNYGNLHASFNSTDSSGVTYFNNLTVHETSDSFWVVQMTCTVENQPKYDREFALWATSVKEN